MKIHVLSTGKFTEISGAQAASGAADQDVGMTSQGGNIMLGGIVFQLFSMSLFVILASEYAYRFVHKKPLREVPKDEKTEEVIDFDFYFSFK